MCLAPISVPILLDPDVGLAEHVQCSGHTECAPRRRRDLDAAALLLAEAGRVLVAAAEDPRGDIRAARRGLEIAAVHAAARTVVELAVAPDDGFAAALAEKYLTIIRFLPKLLDGFDFTANPAGQPILDAAPFVQSLRKRRNPISPDVLPAGVLTDPWRRRVVSPDGAVDKRAFTVAFTEALRDRLRRHDIYVAGLRRFCYPYPRQCPRSADRPVTRERHPHHRPTTHANLKG